MKKVFFLFCLTITITCKSQSTSNLSVHQDLRLLLVGDERGNGIFTPDILVRYEVEVFNFKRNYIYMHFGLEYAGLKGSSFQRFSIGLGYVTSFNFLEKLQLGIILDHGIIFRKGNNFMGLSANFEASYPIAKKLRLSLLYQAIDRNDLTTMYNSSRNIKGSVFIGLKMAL